ncbi:hypothetical protein [Xanthomonas arboricola]|uniref:hypothetical protein n=1 Tax=Xanthomonas arboricola TaxID=56448 RepID=UPI001E2E72CB|nr:hypothetical protein [Xanthomonas arboricola]
MTYFHGTSANNLQNFRFGVLGKGEHSIPFNCIWLSPTFEGAKYHAVQVVGHVRNTTTNYVYEVLLPSDYVIADIRYYDNIDKYISKRIRVYCLGWSRFLPWSPRQWHEALVRYIDSLGLREDTAIKNEIFKVLKDCGVAALKNPKFTWRSEGFLRKRYTFNFFDCVGGEALALLELGNVQISKKYTL